LRAVPWRRLLQLALSVVVAAAGAAQADPDIRIEHRGGVFSIHIDTQIVADAATAWQVLTDYDRLADFVPDLRASRVISAPGAPLRIEQRGETGFLLFRFAIDVVLEIEETPPSRLGFRAIRGNMRRMRGEWRIERTDTGIRLGYEAEMEPDFWVPPLIGPAVMRRDVASQVAGVVREIERRQALAQPQPQPQPTPKQEK
jgi:hypothetical protein